VNETDVPEITRLAGDVRIAEWTTRIPHPLATEDVTGWLAGLSRRLDGAGEHAFAILEKSSEALRGVAALDVEASEPAATLGYWVGQPYWGRGIATEVVRRLVVLGFRDFKLARIEAPVFAGNTRSARVLEKSGFTARGYRTLAAPARGGTRQAVQYCMERTDFARAALSQAIGEK
jgi:RimJ/RimL family protein N-acetyltransferase